MNASTQQLKVYKSSAGSGKTTTLSLEYLKLTLGKRDSYKHILALTFTNKAAQEMKDRILEYLDRLILLDSSKKTPFFVEFIFNESPRYQKLIQEKGLSEALRMIVNDAKVLKKNLLHNYSEYAVTTIDSFTNRLIRTFSHDLGLSFNYQVEMNADQMLKEAVEELVSRIDNKEELITKILTQYSRQKIDSEKSRNIVIDIKSRAKSLLNDVEEEFLKPLRDMELEDMAKLQKSFEAELKAFESALQSFGDEFIQLCYNNGIHPSMLYQGNKGIYGYFNRFKNKDFTRISPNNYVWATVEEDKWTSGKASPEDKGIILAQSALLLDIFEKSQNLIQENHSDYLLKTEINHGIYPFMVLMELEKILNQMKMDQQMIHISDFNKIISEKIADEPAPYIYERIGNKYQHYLLDEFQDTSVIQWHNLLPLVENSLSENHFNLIVGDAKQSIYRFRGSDVEQFAQFPKLITKEKDQHMLQREQLLKRSYNEVFLNANYRTGKHIVDFNNDLFKFIVDHYLPSSQSAVYTDLHQKSGDPHSLASSVEIHQMDVKPLKNIAEKNQAYIERTQQIIEECLESNYQYKDMVVLARKNKHLIQLAHHLLSQGIPVISTESLHVSTSPSVQFLLSVINHLYEPKEKIYQTEIIHFLSAQDHSSFPELSHSLLNLNSKDQLRDVWKQLDIHWDLEEILKLEAYEALESLCRILKLESTEPLLHFFLEAAFIFTQENHQSIGEFREWWALNSTDYKLDVPEEWNAVKLMSFHKSKGLEFPVVINHFSDAHMSSGGFPPEIWLNPNLEDYPQIKSFPFKISKLENTVFEEYKKSDDDLGQLDLVNLFYVAMTRPQQKLYLLVDKYYKKKSESQTVFHFDKVIDDYLQKASVKEKSELIYHLGDENPPKHQLLKEENASSKLESIYIHSNHNTPWRAYIKLALESSDEKPYLHSAIWGQKVHAVLAELQYSGNLDFTLEKMEYQGFIDPEERAKIAEAVQQVLEHPLLKEYYGSQALSYSERDIYDADSPKKSIKRPDYIVQLEDYFVVIDYKTGKAKNEDLRQVKEYCQVITKHSQKASKGFLVYLGEKVEVKEVTA